MDSAKRYLGYKELAKFAVKNGCTIPVLQGVTNAVHRKTIKFVLYAKGWISPNDFKPA